MIPVLWLCGPPGVGKTTVGWEIYSQLTEAGVEAGFVDIDQLGMCYPETAADPGRHLMKAKNLGAVVANFRASGARCVVVSGIVDPAHGVHADLIPGVELTVCRLRAGQDEIRERFVGREKRTDSVESVLQDAVDMDATDFADVCIDTSGLSLGEVTRLVREQTSGWPDLNAPRHQAHEADVADRDSQAPATEVPEGPILWVCGARGVGKSMVGYEANLAAVRAGFTTAFVDLDQIGFRNAVRATDPGNHRMKARNLAAMWRTYHAAGARRLVVVGPVEDQAAVALYTAELPAATLTLCRLHAGRQHLTQRIKLRGQGFGWPQPGDPLRGQPAASLLRFADEAVAEAEALESAAVGDLRVETGDRSVKEIAETIAAKIGWPELAG